MIITSLDIALKTLGLAVLEFDDIKSDKFKILHWDKINILEEMTELKTQEMPKCSGKKNFGYPCKNNGYLQHKETKQLFCKTHSKPFKAKDLKNMKKELEKKAKLRVTDLSYNEISRCVFKCLEPYVEKYPIILKSKYFLYENQPVLKNKMMKNMQIMYLTYFSKKIYDKELQDNKEAKLMKGGKATDSNSDEFNILVPKVNMEFVNATNKLKLCKEIKVPDSIKDKYDRNKYKSIQRCKELIKGDKKLEKEFEDFGKKQDDVADAFLQGLWYYKNNIMEVEKKVVEKKTRTTKKIKK